jgi:hypothetical protein
LKLDGSRPGMFGEIRALFGSDEVTPAPAGTPQPNAAVSRTCPLLVLEGGRRCDASQAQRQRFLFQAGDVAAADSRTFSRLAAAETGFDGGLS